MIIDVMTVQTHIGIVDTTFEVAVILARCGTPTCLGHGKNTRIDEIFGSTRLIHILCPYIALQAYYVFALFGGQLFGHGIERVCLFKGQIAAYRHGLHLGSTLIFVEIEPCAG